MQGAKAANTAKRASSETISPAANSQERELFPCRVDTRSVGNSYAECVVDGVSWHRLERGLQ
jgi:hypothetical protein